MTRPLTSMLVAQSVAVTVMQAIIAAMFLAFPAWYVGRGWLARRRRASGRTGTPPSDE